MPTSEPRVAIVDDDQMTVKTYELLFSHKRVPVSFVAYDGPTAIDKLKRSDPKPNVVIIDYRMPLMSGLDLIVEIRKLEPDLKIVFISGDEDVREEALRSGGNAFLKKPTGMAEILHCIESVVS